MKMVESVKTTVVIPNFNGRHYLSDCLHSLQQPGNKAHIIVVDNGSTDGSQEYVKQTFPEVEVIEFDENRGFCTAVNAGIQAAGTPYVILLNNDTRVYSNFVLHLEQAIGQSDKRFSVAGRMIVMQQPDILDGAGDLYCALGWAFARKKGRHVDQADAPCKIFSACGGAAIYRKEVLERIGLLDENHFAYLEDLDIGYRARIYGYVNYYEPKARVLHAGSGFSGSRYNEFKTGLSSKNSIYVIYKNMPLLQILLNLPFLVVGFVIKTVFFIRKGFGKTYLRGIGRGIAFSCSSSAKEKKIPFSVKHIMNYVSIQLELWFNIWKRITN